MLYALAILFLLQGPLFQGDPEERKHKFTSVIQQDLLWRQVLPKAEAYLPLNVDSLIMQIDVVKMCACMHLLYVSVWQHLQEGRQSLVVPACPASPVSPTQDTQSGLNLELSTHHLFHFTKLVIGLVLCATSMAFLFRLISCLSLLYLNGRPKFLPFTLTPLGAWWQGSWGHNF